MNEPTKVQVINAPDGTPAFVVIPYDEYVKRSAVEGGYVPNEVVEMSFEREFSPMKAWREYLGLTQAEVAGRLGITQAAFAQLENSPRPRKSTLQRVAVALGLVFEQLNF
ncbi:MAG: helix-turn-helix transcriptional regulator [Sterolibacterium sp.]|nr:helix-turn-helix transcriptional regulator [Sterolibacterium sp.]